MKTAIRLLFCLFIPAMLVTAACGDDTGNNNEQGFFVYYSADPNRYGNPFPDDRLLDPQTGLITVPEWFYNRFGDGQIWAEPKRMMKVLGTEQLSTLDGFGTWAPPMFFTTRPPLPATINEKTVFFFVDDPDSPHDGEGVPFTIQYADGDPQVSIRQSLPLYPRTRYSVVLTGAITDFEGRRLKPSPEFARIIADLDASDAPAAETVRSWRYKFSTDSADAVLAFSFTTLEPTAGLLAARDMVIEHARTDPPRLEIDSNVPATEYMPAEDSTMLDSVIYGRFDALDLRDARGVWQPQYLKGTAEPPTRQLEVMIMMPRESPGFAKPFRPIIAMHGLSINKEMYLMFYDYFAERGMALIGVDAVLHGSRSERGFLSGIDFFNFDNMLTTRDNFRQSALDNISLARLIESGIDLDGDGYPDLATDDTGYLGVSLGGILGGIISTIEPSIGYAVLDVPGGGLMDIPPNSPLIGEMLYTVLADKVGMTTFDPRFTRFIDVFLPLVQLALESADPINFAPYTTGIGPMLPGGRRRAILIQKGHEDAIVPNLTTDNLARAMGVPRLEESTYNADGALGLWEFVLPDYGLVGGGMAHVTLFLVPEAKQQARRFLFTKGREILDASAD